MPNSSAFVETTPRIRPFPQPPLNLSPFIRQITTPISNNHIVGHGPVLDRLFQIPNKDFGDQPAVGENNRGNIALQERRGNMLGFLDVRSANPKLPIDDRRVVEENMLFAFTRAAFLE